MNAADAMTTPATLAELLAESPYQAYSYSYPHKTSYRALDPPQPLREAWRQEPRSALLLYVHIPFCEQRCGFCNLFTQAQPQASVVARYLDALERQADVVAAELGASGFARLVVGGGTPTFLSADELERLFAITTKLGARAIPTVVEASPATADPERLAVLRRAGVTRVSMGVQSFIPAETAAVSRHQDPALLARACAAIADAGFPTVNLDLIYGLPGQSEQTLCASITRAIDAGANELYLYPLYVRPLTILGKRQAKGQAPAAEDHRLLLYRAARDFLCSRGWRQASMRLFQAPTAAASPGPAYRCQEDGMLGLGIGARSYTDGLHYSSAFAVDQAEIRRLIDAWCAQDERGFATITHGIQLDGEDRRRRYVILSLLDSGIDRAAYARRFGTDIADDLPELAQVVEMGLGIDEGGILRLNAAGVERSDVIGRWLYSARVRARMAAWQAR